MLYLRVFPPRLGVWRYYSPRWQISVLGSCREGLPRPSQEATRSTSQKRSSWRSSCGGESEPAEQCPTEAHISKDVCLNITSGVDFYRTTFVFVCTEAGQRWPRRLGILLPDRLEVPQVGAFLRHIPSQALEEEDGPRGPTGCICHIPAGGSSGEWMEQNFCNFLQK